MEPSVEQLIDAIRSNDLGFAVTLTDGQIDPPGPRILYVNSRFEKLTGYSASEVVGKTPRILQGPATDLATRDRLKHTLRTGGFFQGETTNYRKNGTPFRMGYCVSGIGRVGGRPAYYLAVHHDADVRMPAEMLNEAYRCHLTVLGKIDPALETVRLLQEQVDYSNSIVDTVRTPILVLDGDLRVMRANRRFYEAFAVHEPETLGRRVYQLGNGQWDIPDLHRLLDDVLPARNPFEGFEVRHEFDRIGKKVMLLNACQLPLTGRRNLILLAFEDVTERKKAEEELADRANLYVAMLAHELRAPLAPILTAVRVMRDTPPGSPAWLQSADMVERQVRQTNQIVEGLLEVSRATRGKIALKSERVDLRAVIDRAVEAVRPAFDLKRHDFRASLPAAPVWMDADPTRLQQVVSNLLSNSAKFTPAGGRVRLEVTPDGVPGAVDLTVRDTGDGIEAGALQRVFEPFVQEDRSLDRAGGGLGLGLTLVKTLVEMHGGRVRAESDGRGRGSKFTVTLPVADGKAKPTQFAQQPAAAGPAPLRVVVVDDNRDAADSLSLLLRAWGHDVTTAYDGRDGLDEIMKARPDAALLDIGLPGLTGYEVAEALTKAGAVPKVLVAISGYGQSGDVSRAKASGFHYHFVKPAQPEDVGRVLAEARQK